MLVYTCFSAKLFCVLIIAYRSVDLAPVASVCCRSQQELDLRQEIMLLNARKTELEHNIASCPNDSLRWVTIPLSDSKVGCCDFRTKAWSYMRAPCASIYIIIVYSKSFQTNFCSCLPFSVLQKQTPWYFWHTRICPRNRDQMRKLNVNKAPRWVRIKRKNRGTKSHDTVP